MILSFVETGRIFVNLNNQLSKALSKNLWMYSGYCYYKIILIQIKKGLGYFIIWGDFNYICGPKFNSIFFTSFQVSVDLLWEILKELS